MVILLMFGCGGGGHGGQSSASMQRPNIVFIVMDDVGIDQLTSFGFSNPTVPAATPNLDALANAGIKFTNTWVMPECSPSRAAFFTGRYPFRTGVNSALINNMLPASQTSPYEMTLPRVLATVGYKSAMVGKFHLGDQNPAGDCAPQTLGFDYFDGNLGASPGAIDTQAGNTNVLPGTYSCGFDQSGASGACYYDDGSCSLTPKGKACLESGGLFLASAACQNTTPSNLDFSRTNSYYVWPRTTLEGALPPPTAPNQCTTKPVINRDYMTGVQTDSAVSWWKSQTGPRMLSVTYNSIHTPFQQPPSTPLLSSNPFVCVGNTTFPIASQRLIAIAMLEDMDKDIGRLMAGLGLARLDANGTIITVRKADGLHIPQLDHSNTLVVVVGDNGTFGPIVKQPFDPYSSKSTVYQTGVWVPLIVDGSMIKGRRGRSVDAMVNGVDFFDLFTEAAGVDANEIVPPAHILDAHPMLSYLTNPSVRPLRKTNFSELGLPVFQVPTNSTTRSWPCVIGATVGNSGGTPTLTGGFCSDALFTTQSFCEQENNGIWLGPQNADQPPLQFPNPDNSDGSWNSCCDVQIGLDPTLGISPLNQWAMRDSDYKLIKKQFADCSQPLCPGPQCNTVFPPFERTTTYEFYSLAKTSANPAGLDCPYGTSNSSNPSTCTQPNDLACDPASSNPPESCVPDSLKPEYEKLNSDLEQLLASEPACTGDGNLDKFVNQFDVDGVNDFNGVSSFFDFNHDATTNYKDLAIVEANLGTDCVGVCTRADLNRDGVVNQKDMRLLKRGLGKPCALCGDDLNGDGLVNNVDVEIMQQAMSSCN